MGESHLYVIILVHPPEFWNNKVIRKKRGEEVILILALANKDLTNVIEVLKSS
jgi:hypothetical protein